MSYFEHTPDNQEATITPPIAPERTKELQENAWLHCRFKDLEFKSTDDGKHYYILRCMVGSTLVSTTCPHSLLRDNCHETTKTYQLLASLLDLDPEQQETYNLIAQRIPDEFNEIINTAKERQTEFLCQVRKVEKDSVIHWNIQCMQPVMPLSL